ncbi:mitochondrial import inner membrane translocase subunit TIM44 isoform X1 [Trachypithecus francoisi]|uniref:mitochondrial import inner membrane translocase subunit TIM44 isoform X1 n=1 Tax=Trachypithecus francoisi TaxID=54180 RepID=UPI00141B0970|nr:mitochondrial import inner membrane translocase subunit TIM44 isoform X1 [Trachypithecus francoisi]
MAAAAALRSGWCRCPRRCLGSGIQFLSSHNLLHGSTYQMRRPGGELPLSRSYSSGNRKGFLSGLLDNVKQELAKNKEMKESIKKFRDEARRLEESDVLQEARRKYKTIESETMRTSEVLRKKLGELTGTVKESLHEVSKSDLGRKIKEGVEEAAKTAKQSAESVSKGGEKLGRTAAFRALSQGVESVKKEIDDSVLGQTGPYRRPQRLRKRTEFAGEKFKEEKVFEPNEEALGVVLHKDSKWYQQWKDFKENNVVFNRFFEMKMKYDESDNAFIRASRALTDKVTDLLGGLFSKTEMSEVLTEILRVDPAFDKDRFLKQCESDIIPNVLEPPGCRRSLDPFGPVGPGLREALHETLHPWPCWPPPSVLFLLQFPVSFPPLQAGLGGGADGRHAPEQQPEHRSAFRDGWWVPSVLATRPLPLTVFTTSIRLLRALLPASGASLPRIRSGPGSGILWKQLPAQSRPLQPTLPLAAPSS